MELFVHLITLRILPDASAYNVCRMLVVAQVVLAMQLPFTLIPLIKATSSHSIMGSFASSWVVSMTAWASSAAVSIANVLMILDVLWKEASQSAVDQAAEPRQQTFTEWLPVALMSMMQCVQTSFQKCSCAFKRAPGMVSTFEIRVLKYIVRGRSFTGYHSLNP